MWTSHEHSLNSWHTILHCAKTGQQINTSANVIIEKLDLALAPYKSNPYRPIFTYDYFHSIFYVVDSPLFLDLLPISEKGLEIKLFTIAYERNIFCLTDCIELVHKTDTWVIECAILHYVLHISKISMFIFFKKLFDVKYNKTRMIIYGKKMADVLVQSLRKYLGDCKYNVLYNNVSQKEDICLHIKDNVHYERLFDFLKKHNEGVLQKQMFKFKMTLYKVTLKSPFVFF